MMNETELQNAIDTMIANGTARSRPGTLGILREKLAKLQGKKIRADAKRQAAADKLTDQACERCGNPATSETDDDEILCSECGADREEEIMSHDPGEGERADAQEAELNRRMGNTSSHTPGPWDVSPDQYHDDELTVVGGETGQAVIATVWPMGDDSVGMDEQAANRRLIVAAPDLLQEIKLLRDEYTRVANLLDLTAHDWNGMYSVDEAIAKAEGRSL